jgi:hypothetical protein
MARDRPAQHVITVLIALAAAEGRAAWTFGPEPGRIL